LVASLPKYYRRLGKVAFEHGRLGELMQALDRGFPEAEADRTDGLKLRWEDRWLHVRASNTEPLLRIAVEARTEEAAGRLFDAAWGLLKN
jgi:phosphomannomutase